MKLTYQISTHGQAYDPHKLPHLQHAGILDFSFLNTADLGARNAMTLSYQVTWSRISHDLPDLLIRVMCISIADKNIPFNMIILLCFSPLNPTYCLW